MTCVHFLIERNDMHERKKLGNFKRRSYITSTASADIITPSLVSLQLSSDKSRHLADTAAVNFDNTESKTLFLHSSSESLISYLTICAKNRENLSVFFMAFTMIISHSVKFAFQNILHMLPFSFSFLGSPLQQLVETVRHSTYLGNDSGTDDAKWKQQTANSKQNSPASKHADSVGKVIDTGTGHAVLPSNIPVISPLALNSLPPNIKAIPLGISAGTGLPLVSTATISEPPASTAKNNESKNDDSLYTGGVGNPTVNVPMELFNQIMNGEITFHSLLSKSKDLSSNNLVGIDTEMGTIPVIPVKGEGGLQLIPIEKEAQPKQTFVQPFLHSPSLPTVFMPPPPNHGAYPFPCAPQPAAAAVNGVAHSTFDGSVLQAKTTAQPCECSLLHRFLLFDIFLRFFMLCFTFCIFLF